ncbi:replication initiation protein [Marinomonas algarum]|uniref:Replication initiation protein n=1 Tax=Marinomonas algarum TaxID=2883105 RepID=A0A9X1LFT3_9GAMM|nr:RepB family plasmid replication initiator protein [Marinomonas algarum]MCB5163183.1 replication initiation protein [Marinomonas algarum]
MSKESSNEKQSLVSESAFNRDTALVTKRNELIAGHSEMSLNENRIFHAAIAMIDSRAHDIGEIRVTPSQLAYALNTSKSNVSKYLKGTKGRPSLLEELQTRYVRAPLIYDTSCITIDGKRLCLKEDSSCVYIKVSDVQDKEFKDQNGLSVFFDAEIGLHVFDENNRSMPPKIGRIEDALGAEINHLGQIITSNDEPFRKKNACEIYVNAESMLCAAALAKGKKSSQLKNISIFDTSAYNAEEGYVVFEFGAAFKPYVIDIKENFTKSYMKYVISLTSNIAADLYDIFRKELPINTVRKGKTEVSFKKNVDELRIQLGITDKYLRLADFKRAVLDRSKEQINGKTDLEFDYEIPERRNNPRAVFKYILFKVKATKAETARLVKESDMIQELEKYFDARFVKNLTNKYSVECCLNNLNLFIKAKHVTTIANPSGWLRDAIKFDYHGTNGVLSLSEYINPVERQFVSDIVREEWDSWDQEERDEFVKYRLKGAYVSIRFSEYLSEFGLQEAHENFRPKTETAKQQIDVLMGSEIYKKSD